MVFSKLFSLYRLQSEVDEVLGNKESVSAEDLEKLQYTEQVHVCNKCNTVSECCMHAHPLIELVYPYTQLFNNTISMLLST